MKISQIKSDIQTVLTNLKQLQAHRDNLTQDNLFGEMQNINLCKGNLEKAFNSLRPTSQKIVAKLKKRKTKRATRTKRLKNSRIKHKSSTNNNPYTLPTDNRLSEQQNLTASNRRKRKDAQKYLDMMDSLENIHQLKCGEVGCKLKVSLKPLQSIWLSTIQAIKAEENNVCSVEAQWDEVLFRGNSEIKKKDSLKDLIERRCVWDSYLVFEDDPNGSHIPIGWVLPKENALPEWKQFIP